MAADTILDVLSAAEPVMSAARQIETLVNGPSNEFDNSPNVSIR